MQFFVFLLLLFLPVAAEAAQLADVAKAILYIDAKDGVEKGDQFAEAVGENIRREHWDELGVIVAAIRYAENGKKGKEYGILHPRVKPTYRSQAGWCAATVQKNYDRWKKGGCKGEFVVFLGNRYCPVGADNDPDNLNKNWVPNVRYHVNRIKNMKGK